jgi:regulator of protease activity HflC (stomatin/prohibitin superfamily)
MGLLSVFIGVVLAVLAIVLSMKEMPRQGRIALRALAGVFVVLGLAFASVAYIPSDRVGIVYKNWLGASLKDGRIIAVSGEMGPQAQTLPPGLHFGYWPFLYTVTNERLTIVPANQLGIIETTDGLPMETGQLFAPEWTIDEFQSMLDATNFLTAGKGRKGKQVSVLTPGTYRLNPLLYKIKMVEQTEIMQGEVGVVKANFGGGATELVDSQGVRILTADEAAKLPADRVLSFAKVGEMGVRRDVLKPGKYPINSDAFTVVEVWSTQMVAHYTAAHAGNASSTARPPSGAMQDPIAEEREITVRTTDGFTFPVDVRVEYVVEAPFAPIVVATLGDDEGDRFRNVLNSAVRAIFRNNAEKLRALDYVQQRSQQEEQSRQMLSREMERFGLKITAVRIGNVGDESSLGSLLKTQTDRELAKQEQITTQEQQKAAEQKKQLSRTQQESEEEKRLATAAYAVKIAVEEQKRKVTEATAEAEAIRIRAEAQASSYRQIAEQIGKNNAAMVELLKVVGERNIQITPRILVLGDQGTGLGGTGTALMGTMLDQMVSKQEEEKK